MIAQRWKAPLSIGALICAFALAGCSQTTTHGMSVSSLTDAITPSFVSARPYRYTSRDRECLERAMFFESNRSSRDGMIAVGTVVMNRLRSGKHGDTVCGVVGERGQFAPGVMTRRMNSKAMPDVREAAEAVLKGERSSKLKNAMFFHTAGLKFPYKNMHYVLVAGGNAFYEKRGRHWKPLPDEPMVAFAGSTPDAVPEKPPVMVASAAPARATDAGGLLGVEQAELPDTAPVAFERLAKATAVRPVAVTYAKSVPLPRNSPFALAAAEQPEKPSKKHVIDPDSAPLPTARAGMVKAVPKLAKSTGAQVVQVAIEEPIAARFGRTDAMSSAEPAMSLGFTQ